MVIIDSFDNAIASVKDVTAPSSPKNTTLLLENKLKPLM